ncbi:MAG TPA: hypothetical protein V6D11_08760 [Waterburya sp.]
MPNSTNTAQIELHLSIQAGFRVELSRYILESGAGQGSVETDNEPFMASLA